MNAKLGLFLVAIVGFFGYRAYSVAQAVRTLEVVPAGAAGSGVCADLAPTQELSNYVSPGHHTVFIFSAPWCGACQALHARLPAFLALRPDVVVRIIDVGDWKRTEELCGESFSSIPHVVIYDGDGNLVASGGTARSVLAQWMREENQRSSKPIAFSK